MQPEGRIRVNALDWISLALVIIGALNWGLIGIGMFVESTAAQALTDWNLVHLVLGSIPVLAGIVYLLVGLAGIYELYFAYQLYRARGIGRRTEQPT